MNRDAISDADVATFGRFPRYRNGLAHPDHRGCDMRGVAGLKDRHHRVYPRLSGVAPPARITSRICRFWRIAVKA